MDPDTGQLVIYSAEEGDAGLWECVASNERGHATAVAQLNRIGETTVSVECLLQSFKVP